MNKLEPALRYLLAIALTVFGADKFLHFMPMPEPPAEGGEFLGALMDAGYIFPIIGGVFLVSAACFALGRVALGVLLLAPITVNIIAYHVRYDMEGIIAGAVIAVLQVLLILIHMSDFGGLMQASRPGPKKG